MGELRWQAPQDPDSWSGTRQRQISAAGARKVSDEPARTVAGQRGLPVFEYLAPAVSGNRSSGLLLDSWRQQARGSADPYIGATMAGQYNMVVVTINYRLGPLGWFTHPALREGEDTLNSSGNYAILDMIKALAWVRDNIEAFGGNPNNVTVAGQSAGGVNVLILMISPLAKGLFHRVISQSGGLEPKSQKDGDEYANSVIEALLVHDGTPEAGAESQRRHEQC